jgi:hypothetical protein
MAVSIVPWTRAVTDCKKGIFFLIHNDSPGVIWPKDRAQSCELKNTQHFFHPYRWGKMKPYQYNQYVSLLKKYKKNVH